jgi:glucosamine--fructose-6-phosphate aminotransferase (isomerizing)
MCGIVGYIGGREAQPVLLSCLARLEYRGYDSCGIALNGGKLRVYKDVGRIAELARVVPQLDGSAGIGHTRWATHGAPSQVNAHPHLDCRSKVAVVHNGIINNFQSLRRALEAEGHSFLSETDTEVIPHLIEKHYRGDLEAAVAAALAEIQGSYAVIVLAAGESKLVVARNGGPLVIGVGDREHFVASDVPAVLDYTNRVIYLEDGDLGVITTDGVRIMSEGREVKRGEDKVLWSIEDAQKAGYAHFMLKEIHEQPRVIRDTLVNWVTLAESVVDLATMRRNLESMLILACGTSYHAALIGKYIIEELLGIPVRVEVASEFNYYGQTLAKTAAIAITQSGETADTLKTMKKLKAAGCFVLAVTNVVGSSASRLADHTIYTRAGPEISVAATKSFMVQLMVLYWLVMSYSKIDPQRLAELVLELRTLPGKVQQVLNREGSVRELACYLAQYEDVFFIGRGINFPVALEGALKLKEVAYIHAEGYAAGELKHGPFALLDKGTPVIAIAARDNTYEAMLSNIKEAKARGAPVIAVAEEGDEAIRELADFIITVPGVNAIFSPVVNTVVLQLLAYYTARERGCPVDTPRNLAKSVTVE